jgi:hypothetical protein
MRWCLFHYDAGERQWRQEEASPFHGEGHRKIWARLRVAGVRTSKRRVLRLSPPLPVQRYKEAVRSFERVAAQ